MPNRLNSAAMPEDAAVPLVRRFRPRLLPTLAALVAIAVFVIAGNWQRERMQAKEALRARYDALVQAAPEPLPTLGAGGDWAAQRFRPVIARGEYDAGRQILVDNRIHAGRAGYHVVTPLKLADAGVVLVNRGWIAAGPSRARLPDAPPPSGTVAVQGRLDVPEAYLELKAEVPAGPVWQNLDPTRFAAATGVTVLPVVVLQTAPPVPDDGLVRDWPMPDFGVEKHRVYMLQWYAFAALALSLWVLLNRRRETPDDHA